MKSEHKACVGEEGPPYKSECWECGLLGPVVAGREGLLLDRRRRWADSGKDLNDQNDLMRLEAVQGGSLSGEGRGAGSENRDTKEGLLPRERTVEAEDIV